MARVSAQRELRHQTAAIMEEVAAGQGFVIRRHGTPVMELRPITPGRRAFVPRARIIAVALPAVRTSTRPRSGT